MTKHIFKVGVNEYEYHIYNSNENLITYEYPILVIYADDTHMFREHYLFRKILKVDDIAQIDNTKYDFLFVFPVNNKNLLNSIEITLNELVPLS